ncbi:MAG TPA: hypothetical protein ENI97_02930 [Gammaproteobacteria bacterium]|nr:hypothetical protein [Gammaproteobacteria bacterium]
MFVAGGAVAGTIANTKHNLGSAGTGNNKVTDTEEICIFCHTPHGADTGANVAVPLWNKKLSDPAVFKTYDQLGTSTYDAAQASIGSVTLACLTCHDGTQAIDNIINAPGSGGYDSTGGGATGLGWTWVTGAGGLTVNADGVLNSGVITNLGTDLTNDHPVSMQYGGGGVSKSNLAGPLRDADFKMPTQIGATDRWYIDNAFMAANAASESDATKFDKWDFKLYSRTVTGSDARGVPFAGEPEPFVECGSCHDPHLETTTFLRISNAAQGGGMSNAGSAICLACHTK